MIRERVAEEAICVFVVGSGSGQESLYHLTLTLQSAYMQHHRCTAVYLHFLLSVVHHLKQNNYA